MWDVESGQAITGPLQHEGTVRFARFSPEGTRVVTASLDGTARIWDREDRRIALPFDVLHGGNVHSAILSPGGQLILTMSEDRTARLWSSLNGDPHSPYLKHDNPVSGAVFNRDGECSVTINPMKSS